MYWEKTSKKETRWCAKESEMEIEGKNQALPTQIKIELLDNLKTHKKQKKEAKTMRRKLR